MRGMNDSVKTGVGMGLSGRIGVGEHRHFYHPQPIYYLGSSDAAYGEAGVTAVATGWVDIGAIEEQVVRAGIRVGST